MSIRVDGKGIASDLKQKLKTEVVGRKRKLSLKVFVLSQDLATEKFIAVKRRFAEAIGVAITVEYLKENLTTDSLVRRIQEDARNFTGVIVQYPLPLHLDADTVRNCVPVDSDVDVLSDAAVLLFARGASAALPPVVGALREVVLRHKIELLGRHVIVVGNGRLVGQPAAIWAESEGARVRVVDATTPRIETVTRTADILILGAGVPGLIQPSMLRDGVVILDAGTSEAGGKLAGDADPACESKASVFTPVPGGIGPITVAMIFKNLLALSP